MAALEARFVSMAGLPGMAVDAARKLNDLDAPLMFGPVEDVLAVENRTVPGPGGDIRVRIYRPDAASNRPVLVYFHGGGWVVGSIESHDGVARHLCRFGRCVVVSVDYRLAPEHAFPAAVEDAWSATNWLSNHASEIGGDSRRLAVGGDSAGGNLSAVVAQRARDGGLRLVQQLLVYPVLDCKLSPDASSEYGYWVRNYLHAETDAADLDASPLRADDLRGVAPAVILSCGPDPLLEQSEVYTRRLLESGVQVEHIVYPALIHGAYRMPGVLDGARQMLDDSAAALIKAFGKA
jgi:acetyl esterase/lipase